MKLNRKYAQGQTSSESQEPTDSVVRLGVFETSCKVANKAKYVIEKIRFTGNSMLKDIN